MHDDVGSAFKGIYDLVKVSLFTITISNLNYTDVQIVNNSCPPIVKILFSFRENKYNLRYFQEMKQQKMKTIRIALETALYHPPQLSFLGYKFTI